MSKDRQAKRKERLKKEKAYDDLISKYPNVEIFSGEDSPNNIHLQIKKTYRQFLIEIDSKKDKTLSEKLFCEFCKFLKRHDIVPFQISSDDLNRFIETPFFLNCFKNNYRKTNSKKDLFFLASQIASNLLKNKLWDKLNLNDYFPKYFYNIGFIQKNFFIKFFKCDTFKSEFGTTYKHFKDIEVDGKKYEIHFSKHSINRICERLFKREIENFKDHEVSNHEALLQAFSEFITHAHFEFCGFSSRNQHLLCCYLPLNFYCQRLFKIKKFNTDKLETLKNHKTRSHVLMRHFYFPFVVMDNKLICKSTLLAGFVGTPEHETRNKIINNNFKEKDFKEIFGEDYENVKNFIEDFYKKESNNSCLFSDSFIKILLIYHFVGKEQFYKGDWNSFPYLAEISKELLAI